MNISSDGMTRMLTAKINDWGLDRIYEIEDDISTLEDNSARLIDYLKDICCSMPLGLALRRYICATYGERQNDGTYCFTLSDGQSLTVSDYTREGYDICDDDIKEYVDIFIDVNKRFNTMPDGSLSIDLGKTEIRRLLRVTTVCLRQKMFLIGFSLHMDSDAMHKMLTDVLAEQTYNYREPTEIIAYFCQSHEEHNSYAEYLRLCEKFKALSNEKTEDTEAKDNYTAFARTAVMGSVNTETELMEFLAANIANFSGYSRTAYKEFMELLGEAFEKSRIQTLSNEEYMISSEFATVDQRLSHEERVNRALMLQAVTNTEQLAKVMLQCIPRATSEKTKNGKTVVVNDFIPIYNGESGQKSKKQKTTTLPKEITVNLLMKDRLDDLIRREKPVERKDLVFLRFYDFSLELQERGGEYTSEDYTTFVSECSDMLIRCGMSALYPANRFENLILLSLLASNPFEMFENIIESSFVNEPEAERE